MKCGVTLGLLVSVGLGLFRDVQAADALPKESVIPVSLALRALQAALDHCKKDG